MRIYTKAGDLPFETFTFPDGQPHFKLLHRDEFNECTVEMAIASPDDVFKLDLVSDVLRHNGMVPNLDVRYLMGARMDRRIDRMHPNTLGVVVHMINGMDYKKIRILDVHSPFGEQALNAINVLPKAIVNIVLGAYSPANVMVVVPDKGATHRVAELTATFRNRYERPLVQCFKERDMATGKLSKFTIENPSLVKGKECLIVDDICDGGGTFVGLAEVLRDAGATQVDLFVTHGIFSKPLPLKGITTIYTTDSYPQPPGNDVKGVKGVVVFPISMKEMV